MGHGPGRRWQREARDPGWPGPPAHAPWHFTNWGTLQGPSKEISPSALGTAVGSDTCGATSSDTAFLRGTKAGSGVSPTHLGSSIHPWRAENSSCPPPLQPSSNIRGPVGDVCLGWAEASSCDLRLSPGSDVPGAAPDVCLGWAKASLSYPGAQAGSIIQGPGAGATCLHGTRASTGCFRPEPVHDI